jgi:hypothetical protein
MGNCSHPKSHPCSPKWHAERGRKLTLAAARREIRAEISGYKTDELISETRGYVWLTTSEEAERYRYQGASHLRKVDLHQLRMLRNECKRRGIEL